MTSFEHTRTLGNRKVFILEPSLVEGSAMYQSMTPENVNKHRLRTGGNLLHSSDVKKVLIHLMSNPQNFETVIRIRPNGAK